MQLCAELGVEYVGFVAFPKSPRHVSAAEFHCLLSMVERPMQAVLVTVDASTEMLDAYLSGNNGNLYLQLHGSESPAHLQEIKQRYGVKIIKAISIATAEDLAQAAAFTDSADILLLDAKPEPSDTLPGGNARSFDWEILQNANLPLPWMLSGGLTPQNVAEALRITHAPMVDISSGVESARGIKCPALIKEFVNATRNAT